MNKIGDTLELALWYNSEKETERPTAERGLRTGLEVLEANYGFAVGEIEIEELSPGDHRVPEPPLGFAGKPRLLVATADIVEITDRQVSMFCNDLERHDLDRLRGITQTAYARSNPGKPPLGLDDIDRIINELGPEAAVKSLRSGIDGRSIN